MEIGEGGHSLVLYAGVLAGVAISKIKTTAKMTRIEAGARSVRVKNKVLNGYTVADLVGVLKRKFK